MAKGDICRISNCKNKITYKGKICGTHRWRKSNFNSYDLPDHIGEPNYLVPLPEGKVKICKRHGYLSKNETYIRHYKGNPNYSCKQCYVFRHHKNKFQGIDYFKLLEKQNNVCAICKKLEDSKANNKIKIKMLAIDHCHKTLKIRGILCQKCNAMLGYAKDSIEILQAAIKYLEEASIEPIL